MMKPPKSYYDAEFGQIIIEDNHWTLAQCAVLGDRRVPICVDFEQGQVGELSSLQREAIRQALALPPDVLRITAPLVLQNYNVYREMIGDEYMPLLANPIQVWEQVTFSYIYVPPHVEYDLHIATFELIAECDWEKEHGLEVRFRNGVADDADQIGETGR
ncbi:MAG: hypothetical protein RMY64_36120 [Nostoc sp. DedQUE08]|uniref:DUF6985 domain-containing protein n=1 Tax=unclassified Nostoc TaxID=2593658 RepID=UPI002AD32AF0|nr:MULTISPECIES: hypothetical protein [unclassified Nostoc]MDZ8036012.1 hypothetical protein [Nostoc sp. DedSLP04]MDZ8070988.1 hypothetical protein [Nostoc sp. DedQUE08]MDZ8094144.1 hypothetical protein [Nostoc sp. DedQUE05]MDZ8137277.1 hypothetical protein [Nostoc sp. DedQUE04]